MNIKHINKGKKDKCLGKEKRLALPKKKKKKNKTPDRGDGLPFVKDSSGTGKGMKVTANQLSSEHLQSTLQSIMSPKRLRVSTMR